MRWPFLFIISLLFCRSHAQLFGSSFLTALQGYGADSCRFISCPLGQYCVNGICQASTATGLYGSGYGLGGGGLGAFGGGLFGAANKLCAETQDCYSGQVCISGRCTFNTAAYGTAGYGLGLQGAGMYGAGVSPYGFGGYSALDTLINRPSGVMMCNLMQDCSNGQICVNGYCSQSNVAYGGSQGIRQPTTCATGAVCPVGQYCIMGVCLQNPLSSTTACGLGVICPYGMNCYLGRCMQNLMYGMYGKKKKR